MLMAEPHRTLSAPISVILSTRNHDGMTSRSSSSSLMPTSMDTKRTHSTGTAHDLRTCEVGSVFTAIQYFHSDRCLTHFSKSKTCTNGLSSAQQRHHAFDAVEYMLEAAKAFIDGRCIALTAVPVLCQQRRVRVFAPASLDRQSGLMGAW